MKITEKISLFYPDADKEKYAANRWTAKCDAGYSMLSRFFARAVLEALQRYK